VILCGMLSSFPPPRPGRTFTFFSSRGRPQFLLLFFSFERETVFQFRRREIELLTPGSASVSDPFFFPLYLRRPVRFSHFVYFPVVKMCVLSLVPSTCPRARMRPSPQGPELGNLWPPMSGIFWTSQNWARYPSFSSPNLLPRISPRLA